MAIVQAFMLANVIKKLLETAGPPEIEEMVALYTSKCASLVGLSWDASVRLDRLYSETNEAVEANLMEFHEESRANGLSIIRSPERHSEQVMKKHFLAIPDEAFLDI